MQVCCPGGRGNRIFPSDWNRLPHWPERRFGADAVLGYLSGPRGTLGDFSEIRPYCNEEGHLVEDPAGNTTTIAEFSAGDVVLGYIDYGDEDWYRIALEVGQGVTIAVDGEAGLDALVRVRDTSGTILAEDDDSGGGNGDPLIFFRAETAGTYFIAVSSYIGNGGGSAGNFTLSVSSPDEDVYGTPGDDILDGGVGADRMFGGAGDDIYIVDNEHDETIEFAGEGTDEIRSSVSWTLSPNTENLVLTGGLASELISAGGNELDNVIVGSGNNEFIDGGAGADAMTEVAGAISMLLTALVTPFQKMSKGIQTPYMRALVLRFLPT